MESQPRPYTSPLRQQQAEDTRRRIVAAALELIAEQPGQALLHEEIAERAGIALRTVYRHFPARPELLDAVWQASDAQLQLQHYPETEQQMLDAVEQVYARMDANAPLMRGLLKSNVGQEMRMRDNERRRAGIERALTDATAHLDAARRREVLGIFQAIFSGRAWETMRDRAHLQEGEPARATLWAMRTLLAQLYREQKSLAREGTKQSSARPASPAGKRSKTTRRS